MVPAVSVTLLRRSLLPGAKVGWKDVMRYIILLIAAAAVFAIWHPAPRPAAFAVLTTANGVNARALGRNAVVGSIGLEPHRRRIRYPRVRKSRPHRSKRHRRIQRGHSHSTSSADAPSQPVDLNRADADALAGVPGFGPALAERIIAYREVNGPFATLDELLDVSGVTPARVDRATPYLILSRN
jgi:competence ComEA-like helix-hairpin-helix protein